MNQKSAALTIGRLAKAAGVNIETIRYYQRLNLIIEPIKPLAGFRHYPDDTVELIVFIKRAQHLGFSLKEIAQLLALGGDHCDDIQQLAIEKRQLIEQQIAGLQTIQAALDQLISSCHSKQQPGQCAFISALNNKLDPVP